MKYVFFLLSLVLLMGISAGAQSNSFNPSLLIVPSMSELDGTAPPVAPPSLAPATDSTANLVLPALPSFKNSGALPALADSAVAEPASPQYVQSVFQEFNWQVYAGYTFMRFYQTPSAEIDTNGLNLGLVYYIKDWVGAEGELTSTFGSQYGDTAKFLMAGGGLRFRWSAPRNIELWAHGLIGGAHYLPRTANGSTGALAYELGGGVDINAGHHRWAYRVAVDAVATQFFSTYQFSPKASAGVVFRF